MSHPTGSAWQNRVANSLEEALSRGAPVFKPRHPCSNGHQSVTRVIDGVCAACAAQSNARRSPDSQEIEKNRQSVAKYLDERALARELAQVWELWP